MTDYSDLVSKILKNDILATAAKQMVTAENSDRLALDLVTTDWAYRLENDIVFQDCQFNPKYMGKSTPSSINYEYETSKDILFDITLVGYCRFTKPYKGNKNSTPSITISKSEPLNKIARVMMHGFGSHITISDEFKFNFNPCNLLKCIDCSDNAVIFEKKGYTLPKPNQPCICTTKLFDGKEIVNRFQSHMEEAFSQTFIALLHLKINTRYNYTDPNNSNQKIYRIGGTVTEMIAFDEAKLYSRKAVNLGNLAFIESLKESDIPASINNDHELDSTESDLEGHLVNDFLHSNEIYRPAENENIKGDDDLSILIDDSLQDVSPSKRPKVEESVNFFI